MKLTTTDILRSGIRGRQASRGWSVRHPDDEDEPLPSTEMQLRAHVFDELVRRLSAAGHKTERLSQQILSFCLPTQGADTELWLTLLKDPVYISDAELQELLDLQPVYATSTEPSPGQNVVYLRSFCFEAGQLAAVLQDLFHRGDMSLELTGSWLEIANDVRSTLPIFIRFCGMSGIGSAWQKHIKDMKSTTLRPMMRFLQATRLLFPEIIEQVNIFEVKRAFVAAPTNIDQILIDSRERAITALLGPETLLNNASGGKYGDTSISREISDDFEALDTRTVELLHTNTTHCPPQMAQGVLDYVLACQKFANNQPLLTGTSSFPFTDALVTVNVRQATPAITDNGAFTPFLMIGHDPALTSFQGAVPFFDLDAFTTQQVTATINSLGSLEEGQDFTNEQLAKNLHAKGYLPVINLIPWTTKGSEILSVILKLTRQYLKATNPLIAVTWGGSGVVLRNWQLRA